VTYSDQDVHTGAHQNTSVTFTNGGASDVTVSSATITGTDPSQFNITGGDCVGATIGSGNACHLDVEFVPTTRGAKNAQLSLVDDSGTVDVPLSGTGITGTLTADPNPFAFNPQPWFFGGQQQSLNLNVSSDAGVQVTSANITGPDASLFYIAWGQNCLNQTYGAGGGCGMGIGFNPPGPGTFNAQLEINSDSASSPLVVPLSAMPLNGPHLTITPGQLSFGAVAVGQERTMTAVVANDGDAPLQIQQLLFITGRPDVFFVTGDTCSGQTVAVGATCKVLVHFKPNGRGDREASLFFIAGNGQQPVVPVGVSGTGVPNPDGAASVTGRAIAGGELTCAPSGFPSETALQYRWLRNGSEVQGATTAQLSLGDGDIGSRFACRVVATNAVGTRTVTSAESARVAARELASQRGSFIDRWACRTVAGARRLSVGGAPVILAYGHPVTPTAPLAVRSRRSATLSLGGRMLGRGRNINVMPAALAAFGDGAHTLIVRTAAGSASTRIALAGCQLALRVRSGRHRRGAVTLSALTGIRSASVRLGRGLRITTAGRRSLGSIEITRAGLPSVSFSLAGGRTRYNGITVVVGRHGLRVAGLPANVGVVRVRLRRGLLRGRGDARASASLLGTPGVARVSAHSS
jgi:hypothetical protein